MHKDVKVSTPSVAGSSELLVLAPICNELVPGLDSVTYKTRAKLLLKALHGGRKVAHEYNLFRALSDAVERVGVIHSVRVAVLEPEDKILLSVNFDGAYEAYVRVIWQKSSRLLDLIFCNTEKYVTGWDHSYDEWNAWLQLRRVETPFYYGAPGLTHPDVTYLQMAERFERRDAQAELNVTRIATPTPEDTAWALVEQSVDPQSGPYADSHGASIPPGASEGIRQGLQGLAGIYRLADLYVPGTEHGPVLHRAARELLPEFVRMLKLPLNYKQAIESSGGRRLREALDWLGTDEPMPAVRIKPPLTKEPGPELPANAQSGILRSYDGVSYGCVCLVAFDTPADFAALHKEIAITGEAPDPPAGVPRWNLALTFDGMRACGVDESLLELLPIEFRQGMAQRAGLLGDLHGNHPRRWQLPRLNWPQAVDQPDDAGLDAPPVPLEAVHAMIQVRIGPAADENPETDLRPRLSALLKTLMAAAGAGVRALSVQWLKRRFDTKAATKTTLDHFGYRDGESQPQFGQQDAWFFPNQVHLGEALLGHPNAADAAPALPAALAPLLRDGSYLVVRKLCQDVKAFEQTVDRASKQYDIDPETIKAKLMGRWQGDGKPLADIADNKLNDFNFEGDRDGRRCPLAAHIRKANPREVERTDASEVQALPGGRPPRLFRRGMSYGNDPSDCGLMFMAYNASIGEQFEVVQRWLAGGNSSGGYSGVSDPLLGVPEAGRSRWFRFEEGERTIRMQLDGSDDLGADPRPLVRLEWGAYLFAPSIDGLKALAAVATQAKATPPWDAAAGLEQIKALQRVEQQGDRDAAIRAWKAALEEPDVRAEFRGASIWAAVRKHYGGVLRIPYGVLVADAGLVKTVLTDDKRFSVRGYQGRLDHTIGPIYLGLDAGPQYEQESKACNGEIMKLSFADGFGPAREAAQQALENLVKEAMGLAQAQRQPRWELNLDVREIVDRVLARIVEEWFGLNEQGGHFKRGGFNWAWRADGPALYPGQFNTPSRHTFQPLPGNFVIDLARRQGQHLRLRMNAFLSANHKTMTGRISRAVLKAQGDTPDLDLTARTLVGAIMGFVPTTDGGLRRIMAEWLRDGTLWRLRASVKANSLADSGPAGTVLHEPITRAMQLRPVPELVWRTAAIDGELPRSAPPTVSNVPNTEHLQLDDTLIVALVSATHQHLEANSHDVAPIFGGARSAQPATTHACPAYLPAMGIITGVLSAIVDAPHDLRPAVTPGILSFEGDVPMPAVVPAAADAPPASEPAYGWRKGAVPKALKFDAASKPEKLLGWGDSWFSLSHPFTDKEWDLRWALAELGYDTSGFAAHSRSGLTLSQMAAVPRRTAFYSLVKAQHPAAVLIDGGGNDVHALDVDASGKQPLTGLLVPADDSSGPFKAGAVHEFVHVRLAGQLKTVLDNLLDATRGKTPIFIHGYDHPLPDGVGFPLFPGPWLAPVIEQHYKYSFPRGCEIMMKLIDELNKMIKTLAEARAADNVHHLKLTGTLAAQPGYDLNRGGGYRKYWLNELHPTIDGYRALGLVAQARINAVLMTPTG